MKKEPHIVGQSQSSVAIQVMHRFYIQNKDKGLLEPKSSAKGIINLKREKK